jgi:glycosyltransferase involved in cell wall biosynthesis
MVEMACVRRAAKVMVLSRFMGLKVQQIHGVKPAKIEVNPGGVDLTRFSPPAERGALKRRLELPEGRIHLLTVRNLEPRMGVDNLIRGLDLLGAAKGRFHLTIVGEGPEGERLANLVRHKRLSDQVSMTGFVSSNRLPEYYGAADFFILPTRALEGFGLVTVESMACGTPVLGTPVGATGEILSPFGPQWILAGADPAAVAKGIEEAAAAYPVDSPKYEELRRRCRRHTEAHYSWTRHGDRLLSIVEEMAASHGQ